VLIATAAKAGRDDGTEVGAHLETGSRCDGWWKRFDPTFGAIAKVDAAKRGIAGVFHGALRQAEQDHGAVSEEADDQPTVRRDFLVDQGVEIFSISSAESMPMFR